MTAGSPGLDQVDRQWATSSVGPAVVGSPLTGTARVLKAEPKL